MKFISRTSRTGVIFLTAAVFLFSSVEFSFSADFDQIIRQMASNGFNQVQADRLLGNWSSAKHSLVKYAAKYQKDPAKLKVLAEICKNRLNAQEEAGVGAIEDAINYGYAKPIEARVATGSWKCRLRCPSCERPGIVPGPADG